MASEQPDPVRREFGFKPREFEVMNPPSTSSEAGGPIDVRDLFRKANEGASGKATTPAENEVHQILRENLRRENAAGLNELPAKPPRRSRRKRDYWISMAAVNAIFVPLTITSFARGNIFLFVFSVAGFALSNTALVWIFWSILDDY